MNEERKALVKAYKAEKRAVKNRRRLDSVASFGFVLLLGAWCVAAVCSVGFVLYFFWVGGLGFVSIGLMLLGVGGLLWYLLDGLNKEELEAARQRKLRANWRD